jgi:hypothetical protein
MLWNRKIKYFINTEFKFQRKENLQLYFLPSIFIEIN